MAPPTLLLKDKYTMESSRSLFHHSANPPELASLNNRNGKAIWGSSFWYRSFGARTALA